MPVTGVANYRIACNGLWWTFPSARLYPLNYFLPVASSLKRLAPNPPGQIGVKNEMTQNRLNIMKSLIILMALIMASCTVKTTVTMPTGEVYQVKNKSDGVTTFEQGDTKISVDNRGRPTVFESLTGAALEKMPTVQIGGD